MNIEWKKKQHIVSTERRETCCESTNKNNNNIKQQQQLPIEQSEHFIKVFFFIRCFFPLLCRSLACAALYCVCFISSLCTNLVWLTAVWRTYMNKYYTLNCVYYRVTIYIFLMAAIFQTKIQFLFLSWILIVGKTEKKNNIRLWWTQA